MALVNEHFLKLQKNYLFADIAKKVNAFKATHPEANIFCLGFSDNVVTQLSLAELHGNLSLSLSKIEEYLENVSKIKKKLVEVATYPFILFVFLIFIILGLRNYLLPQLDRQNVATQIL
ncbi:MAG: type II secretion system F family protein [Prevotella histicola]